MIAPRLALPPGRAGHLWLSRRLAIARRGADLLERKLAIMTGEAARLHEAAERTRERWERACAEAELRLLRARLLGGERAVRLAVGRELAQVSVAVTVTMGARHPAGARCRVPPPPTWDGPALAAARQAHAQALQAAAAHAAASAAERIVAAEVAATRYRLRAVTDRWIPALQQALAQVELSLEELERADAACLRAVLRRGRRGGGPGGSR